MNLIAFNRSRACLFKKKNQRQNLLPVRSDAEPRVPAQLVGSCLRQKSPGNVEYLSPVARDATGAFLGASVVVWQGYDDPEILEAMACREGLALASDLHFGQDQDG